MSRIETHQKSITSRKTPIVIGLLFSIAVIVISSTLIFLYFKGNKEIAYFQTDHPIIYQGSIYKEEGLVKNNAVYLPLEFLKEHIDNTIMLDEKSDSLIITTEDRVLQLPNESLQYFVNEETMKVEIPTVLSENGTLYVETEPLKSIYPFQIQYTDETGAIIIEESGNVTLPAIVKDEYENKVSALRVRSTPDRFAPFVAELSPGEQVKIEKDERNYYLIRRENGVAGYIKKDVVELEKPVTIVIDTQEGTKVTVPPLSWPIHLTWEAVYSKNPDTTKIANMPGLNVVSPTWFSIKNGEGDISNLASTDYVNWAHQQGYQVWAVFSNDFDPEKTHLALKDFQTRQKMIRQLVQYATMYDLDGINIDFENVNLIDRDLVTQFVKELTVYLHQAGLIVSMDITFISTSENWSMFYDREKLATIVDYLIVMAYDEHWATSPVAGSVASLPWVETNLQKLLEVVPNERLVLGIPTYTRIWKEQETPGGNIEVSSKAYGIDDIHKWIEERGLTPQYDDKTGQDFVQYRNEEEKATYKIWIENERSLQKRAQFVHKYGLAGIASWNRSFANEQTWKAVDDALQQLEPVEKSAN